MTLQDSMPDAVDESAIIDTELVADAPEEAPLQPLFADLGLSEPLVKALANVGIHRAFPIQSLTLPVALTGADIIGQAKTGTGKTLGFGLPLLQRVAGPGEPHFEKYDGVPQALVVVPTRELAVQVAADLTVAASERSVRIVTIYGGRAFEPQVEALKRGVEVVVGTPGRLLDLYGQRLLRLGNVRTVVLDEADEMLDLGFLPDVERLIAALPEVRQTMLFSATMPGAVVNLARRYMTQPTHIRANDPDDEGATVKNTTQFVYRAHAMDKSEVVARILQATGRGRTIVFTRTKRTAAKLADELVDRGFAAGSLHGDLGQGAREQALRAFRNNKVDVLVATDVAARGIDVEDVTHVINYQCPEDEKTYLHRIGRTGRAGNKGTAVTFVDWDDIHRWGMVNKALDLGFPEAIETYSTSEHLFSDLNIPAGTKGRLPKSQRKLAGLDAEVLEDLGETGKRPESRSSGESRGGSAGRGRGDGGRDRGGRRAGSERGSSDRGGSTRGSSDRGRSGRASSAGAAPERTATDQPSSARVSADRVSADQSSSSEPKLPFERRSSRRVTSTERGSSPSARIRRRGARSGEAETPGTPAE